MDNIVLSLEFLEEIGLYAYSTKETIHNSYAIGGLVAVNLVPGDIIECGLGAGANFAAMIQGCVDIEKVVPHVLARNFWGFDSFEGIQLAGPKDTSQPGIGQITHDVNVAPEQLLVSSGITSVSLQQVTDNLSKWGLPMHRINLVPGWIQNTLESKLDQIKEIAVLRLDMDIYDPTKFALKHLWQKIVSGGFLIIDDWALDGARLAVEEFFKEQNIRLKPHSVENSTPVYFIKE